MKHEQVLAKDNLLESRMGLQFKIANQMYQESQRLETNSRRLKAQPSMKSIQYLLLQTLPFHFALVTTRL